VQLAPDGHDATYLTASIRAYPSLVSLLVHKDNTSFYVILIPSSGDRPLSRIAKIDDVDAVLPRSLTHAAFLAALEAFIHHIVLGLGANDLKLTTNHLRKEVIKISNVLFLAEGKAVERMIAAKPEHVPVDARVQQGA
jgi:hypothetical protein